MSLDLTVTDLFCGAGGSSIGAEKAGARLVMAANHWRLAIETHNSNFPNADHDCADVSQVDPRRYPHTDILIASPECTNHSQAKSNKHPVTLWNPKADAQEERSRATMWDVPRFAEYHRYEIVVVENVVEARRWEPFEAWLAAMHALGYEHRACYVNSFIAHPTPQSRDRMYIVFWRRGNKAPDLDIRAVAWCPTCETDVQAIQSWKDPTRAFGKYRSQYVYRCPTCAAVALPYAWPAAAAIDWSLPAPRIGDRLRPLAPATLRRIRAGLERYGPTAIVQAAGHTYERAGYYRTWPLWQPLGTQTTTIQHGLVIPLRRHGHVADANSEPVPTIAAAGTHHGLLVRNYSGGAEMSQPVASPLGTVTARDHHSLLSMPFLTDYHGNGSAASVTDPSGTVDTRDRRALVEPAWAVEDCGFRMLEPHEIGRAMAFADDYIVLGNKRDRVRQYGNAVTPPVMGEILRRCIASLSGRAA
jgi:DNA (cytosine-5)-methyltransferase 1